MIKLQNELVKRCLLNLADMMENNQFTKKDAAVCFETLGYNAFAMLRDLVRELDVEEGFNSRVEKKVKEILNKGDL